MNSQAESSDFSSGSLPDTRAVVIFKMNQLQNGPFTDHIALMRTIHITEQWYGIRERKLLYNLIENEIDYGGM